MCMHCVLCVVCCMWYLHGLCVWLYMYICTYRISPDLTNSRRMGMNEFNILIIYFIFKIYYVYIIEYYLYDLYFCNPISLTYPIAIKTYNTFSSGYGVS